MSMDKVKAFFEDINGSFLFADGKTIFTSNYRNSKPKLVEFFYVVKELGLKEANKLALMKLGDYVRVPSYIKFIAGKNLLVSHTNTFVYMDFRSID